MQDRQWLTPIALAREQPVAQTILNLCVPGPRPSSQAIAAVLAAADDRPSRGRDQRLGDVGRIADATGGDERDVASPDAVEVHPGPSQRRDGRDRDVVAEDERRRAGPAAPAVEDDVVDADLQRGIDVAARCAGRRA